MNIYPVLNYASHLKDVWPSGGIAPCILMRGTRWRWVVSFTPRALPPTLPVPTG